MIRMTFGFWAAPAIETIDSTIKFSNRRFILPFLSDRTFCPPIELRFWLDDRFKGRLTAIFSQRGQAVITQSDYRHRMFRFACRTHFAQYASFMRL